MDQQLKEIQQQSSQILQDAFQKIQNLVNNFIAQAQVTNASNDDFITTAWYFMQETKQEPTVNKSLMNITWPGHMKQSQEEIVESKKDDSLESKEERIKQLIRSNVPTNIISGLFNLPPSVIREIEGQEDGKKKTESLHSILKRFRYCLDMELNDQDKMTAIQLHQKGKSPYVISNVFGVPSNVIKRWINENNQLGKFCSDNIIPKDNIFSQEFIREVLENYYIELEKNDRDTDLDLTQISARFNVNKSMIVHWASVFEENVQNIGKAGPKRRGRKRRKYSN